MNRLLKYVWAIIFGVCLFPFAAHSYTSPGQPTGYINDYANVLTSAEQHALESKLTQFTASTTSEIAVVTLKTTGEEPIEEYAAALFKEWGVGVKGKDSGVLLLIVTEDRTMRIEVGYGLEGVITDATANKLIQGTLKPAFQKNNFYNGIDAVTDALIARINEDNPLVPRPQPGRFDFVYALVFFGGFGILFIFLFYKIVQLLQRIWKKSRSLEKKKSPSTPSDDDDDVSRPFSSGGSSSSSSSSSGSSFGGFSGGASGGGGASGKW